MVKIVVVVTLVGVAYLVAVDLSKVKDKLLKMVKVAIMAIAVGMATIVVAVTQV